MKSADPREMLVSSRQQILDGLRSVIANGQFEYRTFGTDIEEHVAEIVIQIFKKSGLIKSENDYSEATGNKNRFPDFILNHPKLGVEFKSGQATRLKNGQIEPVKNSANDLGTLNSWPKKIQQFGGENIYYVFVVYDLNSKPPKIIDVEIGPFYTFIGLGRDGYMSYREKDGNLRPRNFNTEPPIKTLDQFNKLFIPTVIWRSERIIKKHQKIIEEAHKRL